MKPKISVVIPTYNRKKLLGKCLKSVFLQDYKSIEVIVVVDKDIDGTINFVKQNFPSVKIIEKMQNTGASDTKNVGIVQSDGDYILFLDSDIEFVNKSSISIMNNILEKDSEIGTIGGEGIWDGKKIIAVGGRKQTWYHFGKVIYITKEDAKEEINTIECDHLPTCCCMIRRELLKEIGGFDTNYFYMGEDRELGLRVKAKGFKNLICFEAGVNHKVSLQARNKNITYLSYKNFIRCAIKTEGIFGALVFIIVSNFFLLASLFSFVKKKLINLPINFILLWKAIIWNLIHLSETLSAKKINFLKEDKNEKNIKIHF